MAQFTPKHYFIILFIDHLRILQILKTQDTLGIQSDLDNLQ